MANHVAKTTSSKPAKPQMAAISVASPTATTESKTNSGSTPNSLLKSSPASITSEARRAMVAEAAYYIAEQRGFSSGRDLEDWLLAEKQIDAAPSA
jgi:hypothetical protein